MDVRRFFGLRRSDKMPRLIAARQPTPSGATADFSGCIDIVIRLLIVFSLGWNVFASSNLSRARADEGFLRRCQRLNEL
ncbi:hypothetical protein [Aminobacter aminovorans]|uniref:hypothetical protein n=1 Tax=Aminobacter aminovorans TaxID=83263 RepID=UPI0010429788|nr:hypothetical protein [Aminobacter aminovorans]